jgi:hypothetical protein
MPKWTELSRYQQKTARTLHTKLSAAGILTSVTQVGVYLDDAEAWNDGTLTDAELCTRTGWNLPATQTPDETPTPEAEEAKTGEPPAAPDPLNAIKARAARIAKLTADLRDERNALRDDITAADKDGIGGNEIARAADGGLSRPKVFEHLGQVDIMARVRAALRAADITADLYSVDLTAKGGKVLITISGPHSGPPSNRVRDIYALDDCLKNRGVSLGYKDGGALPPAQWLIDHQDAEMVIRKS